MKKNMFLNSVWAIVYPTTYKIAREKNNIKLYGHHSLKKVSKTKRLAHPCMDQKKAIFFKVICGTTQNLRIYFQNLG